MSITIYIYVSILICFQIIALLLHMKVKECVYNHVLRGWLQMMILECVGILLVSVCINMYSTVHGKVTVNR